MTHEKAIEAACKAWWESDELVTESECRRMRAAIKAFLGAVEPTHQMIMAAYRVDPAVCDSADLDADMVFTPAWRAMCAALSREIES